MTENVECEITKKNETNLYFLIDFKFNNNK